MKLKLLYFIVGAWTPWVLIAFWNHFNRQEYAGLLIGILPLGILIIDETM